MGNVPEKFTQWCSYKPAPVHKEKTYSFNQIVDILIFKFNEMVDYVTETLNGFRSSITQLFSLKEDSANITNNRKLSPTGNFTGSLNNQPVTLVLSEIDSNSDQIEFLTEQFSDGATGLVIECGYFEDGTTIKQYDGGVF